MAIIYSSDQFQLCQARRVRPKSRSWVRFCASTLVRLPINLLPLSILSTPLHQGIDLIRDYVLVRDRHAPEYIECSEEEFSRLSQQEKVRSLLYQKQHVSTIPALSLKPN